MFLEGTGSIVFDHINRIAYACKSDRTNIDLLKLVCDHLEYEYIEFTAVDQSGLPIYHTNVMMWIGTNVAAVCTDAIKIPEVSLYGVTQFDGGSITQILFFNNLRHTSIHTYFIVGAKDDY